MDGGLAQSSKFRLSLFTALVDGLIHMSLSAPMGHWWFDDFGERIVRNPLLD